MATLIAATIVVNPETGMPVSLVAGQDVPGWAAGLVGDHLLSEPTPDTPEPEPEDLPEPDSPEGGQAPAVVLDDMKVDDLKAYAAEHEIDLAGATKKEVILAAIKAAEADK